MSTLSRGRTHARPRARRLRMPRLTLRRMGVLVVLAIALGCGWLWLRSSSLVQIQRVSVTGLSGPEVPQIRRALITAAEQMTTLAVDTRKLDAAVSRFPFVRSLRVSTQFPHGAVIHVNEQVPVATISDGGRTVVVDSLGELLSGTPGRVGPLPTIPLRQPPPGTQLTSAGSRAAVQALDAAPYPFISRIANATITANHGIVIQLRNGPQVYFGSTSRLQAKWTALVAVLDTSGSAGAAYIDVSDPSRPAPGAG